MVLRRVDPVHGRVVWSTPDLGNFDDTQQIVAGPTAAYAVAGTTVTAFDAATGHQLWQASLSFAPASPCAGGCAAFVGGHLVTLSRDGTVQSFDGATGKQAWGNRMKSTPRFLAAAGALVAVDDTPERASDHVLVLFNPANGAARTIAPVCAKDPATPFGPARPESEDDWFLSPDGTGLTVLMATIDGCAMHYTLGDGKVTWQDPPGAARQAAALELDRVVRRRRSHRRRLDDRRGAGGDRLRRRHRHRRHPQAAPRRPQPVQGGRHSGCRGVGGGAQLRQQQAADLGVDLATGRTLWQLAYRGGSSSDDQNVSVTATAVRAAVCHSDAKQCAFKALDPRAGTVNGTSTVAAGFSPRIDALSQTPQSVLVVADGHLVVLDPRSAAIKAHFS